PFWELLTDFDRLLLKNDAECEFVIEILPKNSLRSSDRQTAWWVQLVLVRGQEQVPSNYTRRHPCGKGMAA
ncbi:MAG TPA: hypothetical protein PKY45_15580, partial [Deltaproteobacteria bacterium]|nr:hypothetical protein [Deltaproteobacteria bacterium]